MRDQELARWKAICDERDKQLAELRGELEAALERLEKLETGPHSCSIYCKRPLCVAHREIHTLRTQLQRMREWTP